MKNVKSTVHLSMYLYFVFSLWHSSYIGITSFEGGVLSYPVPEILESVGTHIFRPILAFSRTQGGGGEDALIT